MARDKITVLSIFSGAMGLDIGIDLGAAPLLQD
jgi:site-specific DNA-cytosine methylase